MLYNYIVQLRKSVDVISAHVFFHEFAKSGKIFTIKNCSKNCGLNLAVYHFRLNHQEASQKKNSSRTKDDGLRLSLIMLDPEFRSMVVNYLTNPKDRRRHDQSTDPDLALFEVLLAKFQDNQYIAEALDIEDPEDLPDEKDDWNPNNPAIFKHKRTAAWLKETWEKYVKPKFKRALNKWNKDTGGGDGRPVEFHKFCMTDTWMVWIFAADIRANFLLGSSAGGRMPAHLQMESGFEMDVSTDDSPSRPDPSRPDPSPRVTKRRFAEIANLEKQVMELKKQKTSLEVVADKVLNYLESKTEASNAAPSALSTGQGNVLTHWAKAKNLYDDMQNTAHLDSLSPESREVAVTILKAEHGYHMGKMKEHSRKVKELTLQKRQINFERPTPLGDNSEEEDEQD